MKTSHKITALLMTTVFSLHQMSFAQKVETTGDASIVTYEKEYFEKYSAVTLLDMLNIIPGVKEILDKNKNNGGERGFGSGGDQILIDGKRLAGKSNSIDDTLGRISAGQIEKIELIRGATSGLDVQSQGLVINIILADGASTSSTFWKVSSKYTVEHDIQPKFLVSHNGSTNGLDYTFSAERNVRGYSFDRTEQIFNSSGVKTADQFIDGGFRWKNVLLNSNLGYTFVDGGQLRLNGLYEPAIIKGFEIRNKTSDTLRPVLWDTNGKSDEWEIGGDYTRAFDSLGTFKSLFVLNSDTRDDIVNRFKGTGDEKFEYNTELTKEIEKEKIIRASLTTSITSKQSIEYGGEVAINTVGGEFINRERNLALDPLTTTNSDVVDIKENRYEIFAHHTYNISPKLVLQSSLTAEFSKIVAKNTNAGVVLAPRNTSFTYLKPRVNLRYDITNVDQFRVTVEKKVSQLDFDNFVTSFDSQTETLRLGNTNIRPEQIWEYSAAYEHRFANDGGSIEAEIFYHDYTDHITRVDFTEYENLAGDTISASDFFALSPASISALINNGSRFTSKSGNVDSAKVYGVKLKSNIRLGMIGLPEAVVGLGYTYEKKETIDQFTIMERPFDRSPEHFFTFNFRHDITSLGLAYGFEGEIKSDVEANDIRYHWEMNPGFRLEAFAEYNLVKGIKMRLDVENINQTRGKSNFIGYRNHIALNDSYGNTLRHTKNYTELSLSVQGTF